jgi:hypothetical protein
MPFRDVELLRIPESYPHFFHLDLPRISSIPLLQLHVSYSRSERRTYVFDSLTVWFYHSIQANLKFLSISPSDTMAEWSKAVDLSPASNLYYRNVRGFEPHSCHFVVFDLLVSFLKIEVAKRCRRWGKRARSSGWCVWHAQPCRIAFRRSFESWGVDTFLTTGKEWT